MFHHSSGTLAKINSDALGRGSTVPSMDLNKALFPPPYSLLPSAQLALLSHDALKIRRGNSDVSSLLDISNSKTEELCYFLFLLPITGFFPVKLVFPGPQVEPRADYWEGPFSVIFMFANILATT